MYVLCILGTAVGTMNAYSVSISWQKGAEGNSMTALKPGENLEDLQRDGLMIIQHRDKYKFTQDAVFLAHFTADISIKGHVVDLGTGSGVIPILLSSLLPDVCVTGLEIQDDLADMAARSVFLNGLEERIRIVPGDLRDAEKYFKQCSVDAVVSNPPYMRAWSGPSSPNPGISAARQELFCTIEDVVRSAEWLLKGRGSFFLVHRPERLVDIFSAVRKNNLEPKRLRFVIPGKDREPRLVLLHCVKDAAPDLKVLKPLVVFEEDGVYTDEANRIFYGC